MNETIGLAAILLERGAHASPEDGMCVMEAVAYVAREPFSEHPACASVVIGAFMRNWNDNLSDGDRQMLKPYIPQLVGTATGAADEETRAWLATDWLVRECAPAFLRLAGLTEHATVLENLAALTGRDDAVKAKQEIDAAGAAAWAAAGDAAGAAAWDAAWDAAGAAAWAAAGDAAGDAAWAELAPTVKVLQRSALGLLDRMIAVGKVAA